MCGVNVSRAWAFLPVAAEVDSGKIVSLFHNSQCDFASVPNIDPTTSDCPENISSWYSSGLLSAASLEASKSTINSVRRAEFAGKLNEVAAAEQMGYEYGSYNVLAMRDIGVVGSINIVDNISESIVFGQDALFHPIVRMSVVQIQTGRTTIDSNGMMSIVEEATIEPMVVAGTCTILGVQKHAVLIGGQGGLNGFGACPIWLGRPVAVFSHQDSANDFAARLYFDTLSVESQGFAMALSSDLPQGFQPEPGTIVDPTPRDRWPSPGDVMWCFPEGDGVTCEHWNDDRLKCWSVFQEEIQAARDTYDREVAGCSFWDGVLEGGALGGTCGGALGACAGGVGAIPGGFCGAVVGGIDGGLFSRYRCKRKAMSVYEVNRDIAIRNYVNCLRDMGVRVE